MVIVYFIRQIYFVSVTKTRVANRKRNVLALAMHCLILKPLFIMDFKKKFLFSVDGRPYSTEHQFLIGEQIKRIAGVPADFELFLVIPHFQDELIEDNKTVNFARPGVERFESRRPKSDIVILVNGVPVPYNKSQITFEELVKIAYPNMGAKYGFTISYTDGPVTFPGKG